MILLKTNLFVRNNSCDVRRLCQAGVIDTCALDCKVYGTVKFWEIMSLDSPSYVRIIAMDTHTHTHTPHTHTHN